jgi:VWFA-related protein
MGKQLPVLALIAATLASSAQAPQTVQPAPTVLAEPPQPSKGQQDTLPVLHTGTQLVVVDVVVEDKQGHPVHGLTQDDFVLTENKKPQTVNHFDEHSNTRPVTPGPQLPPMPPGTFTDYVPTPSTGALNILLLDSLNTPMKDQSYVRYELQQFVKKSPPGTSIAIFGLAQHLYILQGFSSDPQVLKDAIDHKLIPRASVLLDDPVGAGAGPESMSESAAELGIAASPNLTQFEAEETAFQTQLRIQYTIDAFDSLGHYLSAFPGRKNLIWFSGSFPIDILPDPSIDNSFAVMEDNSPEFREMTNLLAQSQVAVYPVDARGLMTNPVFDASQSGRGFARNPASFGKQIQGFAQSQALEHMTMEQLAEDTGGAAFYNNNDLAAAVSKAILAGSNFYTLTYSPENKKWDGGYRNIKVTLARNLVAANYTLAYRHGYYADDPAHLPKGTGAAAITTAGDLASENTGESYTRAAEARGAPAPEDILFKVRVLPAVPGTEDKLTADNQDDPQHPLKGPFKRFDIDFAALTSDVKITKLPDGRHTGQIEFFARLYDPDGKLLNITGKTVQLNLTADAYAAFQHGMGAHLEISAPVKGESYLRVGIRDVTTNRIGVTEIPLSKVAKLTSVAELSKLAASPAGSGTTPPATAAPTKP